MNPLGTIDRFIQEVNEAADIEAVTRALRKHVDFLGFERFSYQLLKSPTGPRPQFFISAYPLRDAHIFLEYFV